MKFLIDWSKVKEHVGVKLSEEDSISIDIPLTNEKLPKVTIITNVHNSELFNLCVYSWNTLMYPKHLLNWVVINTKKLLTKEQKEYLRLDKRVKIMIGNKSNFDKNVRDVMKMDWIRTADDEVSRPHNFMSMECGDIMFPETLLIKHRAMVHKYDSGYKDCVAADTIAYYDTNSVIYSQYIKYPRNGLYWKKSWWNDNDSSKVAFIPYIGNCITIGTPVIECTGKKASVRFFENFTPDVKVFVRNYYLKKKDDDSDVE